MPTKYIRALTPETLKMANTRLPRLRKKLEQIQFWLDVESGSNSRNAKRIEDLKKQIRSTKTAIDRWEKILAGKEVY